jgi:hypothetical protein
VQVMEPQIVLAVCDHRACCSWIGEISYGQLHLPALAR